MFILLHCVLLAATVQGSEPAAPERALAAAVRAYYDGGPAAAQPRFEALLEDQPQRGDLAWWSARCLVDLGQPAAAALLLDGAVGQNVPAWRFPALAAEAHALAGHSEPALQQALAALAAAPDRARQQGSLSSLLWMTVALAARHGDDATASSLLQRGLQGPPILVLSPELYLALPEVDAVLAAPLAEGVRLAAPLYFQARGSWWLLPETGGLARRREPPAASVAECSGPDLCRPGGAPLFPTPGARFTPHAAGGSLWYGAAAEPLAVEGAAAGIFLWSGEPGEPPVRWTEPAAGEVDSWPQPGASGELFYLRRGEGGSRVMRMATGEPPVELAPDLAAIASLAVVGELLVLSAVLDSRTALRWLPLDADPSTPSRPLLAVDLGAWDARAAEP